MTQICHIEAAEEGGQRYNKDSNDEYRRSFENLILLCPNHHVETNNVAVYTVEVLKAMKQRHEARMLQSKGAEVLTRNPRALNFVINKIGVSLFSESVDSMPTNAPDPETKIEHNNVIRYQPIIEEYKVYHGKLNRIYEEIERSGSPKKDMLLRNIHTIYLKEKGKYGSSMDEIRKNADNIIEQVEKQMWAIVEGDNAINDDIPIEAIEFSLLVIIVDAFMRCKILEKPL